MIEFQHRSTLWWLLGILGLSSLVYAQSMSYGFLTNYDDGLLISANPVVNSSGSDMLKWAFGEFVYGLYHPVTSLSFALDNFLFGGSSKGFHLVNTLLHLWVTVLVFLFSRRILNSEYAGLVAALLFAIHPMHVESVVWLSERKDLLYTGFFLSGLSIYLKERRVLSWKVILLFLLSVLSKPAAVVFPAVLVLLDIYETRRWSWKRVITKWPYFLIALVFGYVNIQAQDSAGFIRDLSDQYSVMDRFFMASFSLVYYLFEFIIPVGLSPKHFYPSDPEFSLTFPYWISPIVMILLAYVAFRFRKRVPLFWFSLIFYLITIALVIKLVPTGNDLVNERYSYLPYVGLGLITAHAFISLMAYARLRVVSIAALILSGLAFAFISFRYIPVYQNEVSLWSHVIQQNPQSSVAFMERGRAHISQSDFNKAIIDLNAALFLDERNALAYNNRGLALASLGNSEAAIKDYDQAIELDRDYAIAYSNRGIELFKSGQVQLAISDFEQSIELDPGNASNYNNYGIALAQMKRMNEAKGMFERALELQPKHPNALKNLERITRQ